MSIVTLSKRIRIQLGESLDRWSLPFTLLLFAHTDCILANVGAKVLTRVAYPLG